MNAIHAEFPGKCKGKRQCDDPALPRRAKVGYGKPTEAAAAPAIESRDHEAC
jgi:hypothetical protein